MKQYIFLTFILINLTSFGQETKKYFYETGQLKSEIATDKTGLLTKYLSWDIFGNLLTSDDYSTEYKNYPKNISLKQTGQL